MGTLCRRVPFPRHIPFRYGPLFDRPHGLALRPIEYYRSLLVGCAWLDRRAVWTIVDENRWRRMCVSPSSHDESLVVPRRWPVFRSSATRLRQTDVPGGGAIPIAVGISTGDRPGPLFVDRPFRPDPRVPRIGPRIVQHVSLPNSPASECVEDPESLPGRSKARISPFPVVLLRGIRRQVRAPR